MFGSDILEVAIGIVFVFLIISIVVSAIREGLESILKTRAAYLEAGIRELLGDRGGSGLAEQLYSHPIVSGLYASDYQTPPIRSRLSWMFARGRNLPSYIPARNFALAMMDLAARGPVNAQDENRDHVPLTIETLRRNLPNVQNPTVRRVMLTALDSANGDLDNVRQTLQAWYDSSMDRVSGWYKRSTQWIIFAIGVTVAVAMDVDTIEVTKFLYTNKAARSAIVADAAVAAAGYGVLASGLSTSTREDHRRVAAAGRLDEHQDARRRSPPHPRLARHGTRLLDGRAILVRSAEQDDGDSLDGEAAREEPGGVVGRPPDVVRFGRRR